MKHLLVDNGSLRPESILNLRRIAQALSDKEGIDVLPASLLHSSKVDPEALEGEPAVNLERRLRWFLQEGVREFTVIPFFFGPTAAILDYLPQRLAYLRGKFGDFNISRTPFLFEPSDSGGNVELLSILSDNVRDCIVRNGLTRPRVALVDHGSPLPAVTEVRNCLAQMLAGELHEETSGVEPASMERRPGDEFAFNEPLLERLLLMDDWRESSVVICMQFLSPGRHAGPDGDIARICSNGRQKAPLLRTFMTDLVGTHPLIHQLLSRRLRERRQPIE